MNKLNIVGIGPGAREYLTLNAVETIEKSDVLVGSKRSLELFDYLDAQMVVLEPRDIPNTVKKAVSYLLHQDQCRNEKNSHDGGSVSDVQSHSGGQANRSS